MPWNKNISVDDIKREAAEAAVPCISLGSLGSSGLRRKFWVEDSNGDVGDSWLGGRKSRGRGAVEKALSECRPLRLQLSTKLSEETLFSARVGHVLRALTEYRCMDTVSSSSSVSILQNTEKEGLVPHAYQVSPGDVLPQTASISGTRDHPLPGTIWETEETSSTSSTKSSHDTTGC